MTRRIWCDTESLGFCGPTTTIQIMDHDGSCHLVRFVHNEQSPNRFAPATEADHRAMLYWLDAMWDKDTTLVGYNLGHDVFKLCGVWHSNRLGLRDDSFERPVPPPLCKFVDLQIHAATRSDLAPFASGSGKAVAHVRRIPRVAAHLVVNEVESRLRPLIPAIMDLTRTEHEIRDRPELVSYSWSVQKSMSLKRLAAHWGYPTLNLAEVWPLPRKGDEIEIYPYLQPCTESLVPECNRILNDPTSTFFNYARLDPIYTRIVDEKLGCPETTSNDTLAGAVGYTRYHGFALDRPVLEEVAEGFRVRVKRTETLFPEDGFLRSSVKRVKFMQQFEPGLQSTAKKVLEDIIRHKGYPKSEASILANSSAPAADLMVEAERCERFVEAAELMMDYGMAKQRLHQAERLLGCRTGRLHCFVRVYGTASNRSAGSGGFNVQGIERGKGIRRAVLMDAGGDYDSLEFALAPVVYGDAQLLDDTLAGRDPHIRMACEMPTRLDGRDPAEVQANYYKGHPDYDLIKNERATGKTGVYAELYGAAAPKLASVFGCTVEEVTRRLEKRYSRYPGLRAHRQAAELDYMTADVQTWSEDSIDRMKDYAESFFGWRRSFAFEKLVAQTLWRMASRGIRTGMGGTVVRNAEKGPQPIDQAIRSALFGAVTNLQAAVYRQATNHEIQCTGSEIAKALGAVLWEKFHLPLLLVHDEDNVAQRWGVDPVPVERITAVVDAFNRTVREKMGIPTVTMGFGAMKRWSDK